MKFKTFLMIMSLLIISGCAPATQGASDDFSVIHSGKEFSKTLPGAKVFNSAAEYESFLMARAMKKNTLLSGLDFSRNSLVVAYLGKRGGEGFGLKIISISQTPEEVIVEAKLLPPESKGDPQQFIVIGKTHKKARLILN